MRAWAQQWVPPRISGWWRKWRRPVRHEGHYSSWSEAVAESRGYDAENLVRVRKAALQVKAGQAAFERDGVTFAEPEVSWPALACLLTVGAEQGGRLDVVDFGGSLGSFYYQHRGFWSELGMVRWRVVEQPAWVQVGRAEFESEELRFYSTIEAAEAEREAPQVLLLSAVLPYLPDPQRFMADVSKRRFVAVVIDRTGMLREGGRDRLTVQRVRPPLFHASYPCWFFTRGTLLAPFAEDYRLRAEFAALDGTNIAADYRGFFLQRSSLRGCPGH
jgi:hypothetical protein